MQILKQLIVDTVSLTSKTKPRSTSCVQHSKWAALMRTQLYSPSFLRSKISLNDVIPSLQKGPVQPRGFKGASLVCPQALWEPFGICS